jgi:tRNA pseudouridine55 synthase
MSEPAAPALSGILLIDKPLKLTSMTVCAAVRRRLVAAGAPKRVKVGHGGTLDPLATGLLVVLVGKSTKLCNEVMAGEKRYLTDIDLSITSPTDDLEGPLAHIEVPRPPSRDELDRAVAGFVGEIQQRPPIYSAMKIGGERAYKLARRAEDGRGEVPEMAPRPVMIHAIDVLEYAFPLLRLDVRCGKGTYIRSLARDIGIALGTGGCLTGLRRTQVGRHTIEWAVPLDSLPPKMTQADLLPPL